MGTLPGEEAMMMKKSLTARILAQWTAGPPLLAASIALATAATAVAAAPSGGDAFIHQELNFKASPARIYEALLDEKEFSIFSGAPARIQREAGGAFTLIGGRVTGRNVELIPNQRIVQAWRATTWPSGVYLVVSFKLTAVGSGTRIVVDQTAFPPADREALNGTWSRNYWDPLRQYLDGANGGWSRM